MYQTNTIKDLKRVLLGTPISMYKQPVIWDWLAFIRTLSYPVDILLVDNSPDPEWHKKVARLGFEVLHVEPKGYPAQYVTFCQEMIRRRAVDGNYDYLFSLECDNFAPHDIIQRLMAKGEDNVNAPYLLKKGKETCIGVQKVVYKMYGHRKADVFTPFDFTHIDGQLKQYTAPSIGCSLFSRKMFTGQQFRYAPNDMGIFSDSFWHLDSNKRGIPAYVATDLFVEHRRQSQWDGLVSKKH